MQTRVHGDIIVIADDTIMHSCAEYTVHCISSSLSWCMQSILLMEKTIIIVTPTHTNRAVVIYCCLTSPIQWQIFIYQKRIIRIYGLEGRALIRVFFAIA